MGSKAVTCAGPSALKGVKISDLSEWSLSRWSVSVLRAPIKASQILFLHKLRISKYKASRLIEMIVLIDFYKYDVNYYTAMTVALY